MNDKIISNQNENAEDKISCLCASMEIKIEDYTLCLLGQELTRKIEVQICRECGEKHTHGKPLIEMEAEIEAKVIALANERLKVPEGHIYLKYFDEVDSLYIKYRDANCVKCKSDDIISLLRHFDSHKRLISIDIFDFYDKYATEESNDEN